MDFDDFHKLELLARLAAVIGAVVLAHLVVSVGRAIMRRILGDEAGLRGDLRPHLSKMRTVTSLVLSAVIFTLYFGALGYALTELGVPLTTYLAGASIIGLAVAFGSQGLVQDVVTGLTVIFSDIFDVGDMVEIGGQTGIVRRLGMRFTMLTNAVGAAVFIPNRSITSVINYPRGYIRCLADVTLSTDAATATRMEERIRRIASAAAEQFPGILRTEPDYEGVQTTAAGRAYLRVKFRIWPGRGGPIETPFRQEVLQAMKAIDPDYADWMIAVTYEVESRRTTLAGAFA